MTDNVIQLPDRKAMMGEGTTPDGRGYAYMGMTKAEAEKRVAETGEMLRKISGVDIDGVLHIPVGMLLDPMVVGIMLMTGRIAKPSIENIIGFYGEDALRAALSQTEPAE